jgi:hypothetical protein
MKMTKRRRKNKKKKRRTRLRILPQRGGLADKPNWKRSQKRRRRWRPRSQWPPDLESSHLG